MNEEKCKSFLLKAGSLAVGVLIVVAAARYLLGPLTPFIIAFIVAALLQPVVKWMAAKLRMKTGIASTIAVVLAYIVVAGIVLLLIIGLLSAAVDWASGLPDLFEDTLAPWVIATADKLPERLNRINPELAAYAESMLPDVVSTIGTTIMNFSVSLVSWASSVGTRLPGAMMTAIICIIASVFVTSDYDNIVGAIMARLPEKARRILHQSKVAAGDILRNFAKSYLLILFITFVQIAVGLLIIGMDNALFIAVLVALFDILPIVGSGMILLPWTIFKLVQNQIGKAVGLGILYLFVVISRQIIEPRIVGNRVGLHPLSTLVCMWLGLKVIGGVGMFMLPILVLIIKDLKTGGFLKEMSDIPDEAGEPQNDNSKQTETEEAV